MGRWCHSIWGPPPKEVGKGRVKFYEVQRTRFGEDEWRIEGATTDTYIRLDNQERGMEWEYRVIAANKEGQGMDSNVVTAVL